MVDILIVVFLVLALVAGIRAGLFTSAGWLIGLCAGGAAVPWAIPFVNRVVSDSAWHGLAAIGTTVALLAVGAGLGGGIGAVLRRGADRMRLRAVERVLGGVVGAGAATLALTLAGMGIASAGVPVLSSAVASSQVLRAIERVTPAPVATAIAQLHAGVMDDTLPTIGGLFGGGTATIPLDVATDDPALVTASASVARITGVAYACGRSSAGSGFVAAEDRVVTNAHVVAGVETPVVELPGEPARDGRVVYFDPVDDLAVIAVDVEASPLPIDTLAAGDSAAVQGYPYGGPFQTVAAQVVDSGTAIVADIYESGTSPREVFTLAAEVVPGNSGGPLLTPSGAVAGVVFARDEAHADVGYAMTAAELLPVLASLGADDATVSSGGCLE